MSRFLSLGLLLLSSAVFAKPWQGIVPGVSSTLDVFGKFGQPTNKTDMKGQTVLIYAGLQAIPGTVQAQFKLTPAGDTVARIDVYVSPVIDKAAVEESYGPQCPPKKKDPDLESPCYFLKESGAGKKPHFIYQRLGLAVFFKEDGTVLSFAFLPSKA